MYPFLNLFFFVFHSAFIAFVLAGWLWRPARKAHLAAIALTAFSWGVLGIWFGFGYCPCTDWHWRVRMALGYTDMPSSYIKFLVDAVTGWNTNARLVDAVTCIAFVLSAVASVCVNVMDYRGKEEP